MNMVCVHYQVNPCCFSIIVIEKDQENMFIFIVVDKRLKGISDERTQKVSSFIQRGCVGIKINDELSHFSKSRRV